MPEKYDNKVEFCSEVMGISGLFFPNNDIALTRTDDSPGTSLIHRAILTTIHSSKQSYLCEVWRALFIHSSVMERANQNHMNIVVQDGDTKLKGHFYKTNPIR